MPSSVAIRMHGRAIVLPVGVSSNVTADGTVMGALRKSPRKFPSVALLVAVGLLQLVFQGWRICRGTLRTNTPVIVPPE